LYDIGKKYIKCKIIFESAQKELIEGENSKKLWDDMGFFEKLKFYNIWYFISIFGNII
jgi:hypothetical protein